MSPFDIFDVALINGTYHVAARRQDEPLWFRIIADFHTEARAIDYRDGLRRLSQSYIAEPFVDEHEASPEFKREPFPEPLRNSMGHYKGRFEWTKERKARATSLFRGGASAREVALELGATIDSVRHHKKRVGLVAHRKKQLKPPAKPVREHTRPQPTAVPAKLMCLSCNTNFDSPDKVRIRICKRCKKSEEWNGAQDMQVAYG